MKTDFWEKRGENMVCRTCMYFLLKKSPTGRCKRHAPTMTGYPVVYEAEPGCGDHKVDETHKMEG